MSALPTFDRPPVFEIVCAVQFVALPQFGFTEAVRVAPALAGWRIADVPPAIPPIVEAESGEPGARGLTFNFGAPPVRLVLESSDSRWLVQVQQDRLAIHERKTDSRPSSENVFPKLEEVAALLAPSLERDVLAQCSPELVELTYVNRLPVGQGWNGFAELDQVLKALRSPVGDPPYDDVEALSVGFTRPLRSGGRFVGRLRVQADPARWETGASGLHLQLMTRRYVLDRNLRDVLDDCHTDIVEGFAAVTTDKMQAIWGRSDRRDS